MIFFVVAAVALVVLALSLVFDDVLDGVTESIGGPDWLSLPVLAGVVAGFGLVAGAVDGTVPDAPLALSLGAGLVGGVAVGALAARFIAAALHMPTDRTARRDDMVGRVGRVVTAVTPDQPGEALVELGGSRHKVRATADEAIPVGAEVVVVEATSATSVVVAHLGFDQLPAAPPTDPGRDRP